MNMVFFSSVSLRCFSLFHWTKQLFHSRALDFLECNAFVRRTYIANYMFISNMVQGEEEETHVGQIVEFFKTTDGESYFRVQWFYRATDTVCIQVLLFCLSNCLRCNN